MAVDMFLKIPSIKGESVDSKHKDEMQLESISWGISNGGTAHMGTGAGGGKAMFQDLTCTMRMDKSSPVLAQHCANGKHIPKAELFVRRAGDKPLEYLKFDLTDIIVSSMQWSNGGDEFHVSFSLNFAEFKAVYTTQKADGSAGPTTEVAWNIAENVLK